MYTYYLIILWYGKGRINKGQSLENLFEGEVQTRGMEFHEHCRMKY
jgi:hypothetical protein